MSGKKRWRGTIKSALDNLPMGLCYFNNQGLLILYNHVMSNLVFDITKQDIQYEPELFNAIMQLKDEVYISPEGEVWKFLRNELDEDGFPIIEYMASNITELYQKNKELSERNLELNEMISRIQQTNRNIVAIARAEEILSLKMHMHNEMGKVALNIRKYALDSEHNSKEILISQIENAISVLRGDLVKAEETDQYEEFTQVAESIGAKVVIDGKLPEQQFIQRILISAMRECLTNVIRHANGNTMYVSIGSKDNEYIVEIRNNGEPPKTEIVEGGGLSSLRRQIENAGGVMRISSSPEFCLFIYMPEGGNEG